MARRLAGNLIIGEQWGTLECEVLYTSLWLLGGEWIIGGP